jgi:hypothetical protein
MILYAVIIAAALARVVPHAPNVSLITALAIFAGAYLPARKALGVTLLARLFSDIVIGFFSWPLMVAVYASHLAGILLGRWIASSKTATWRWLKIGSSGFVSATVFFLVTNFAFLYSEYPHTWTGVVESYVNGLPFLRGTLVGDVGGAVALFGAYAALRYGASFIARLKYRHQQAISA